MRTIRNIAIVRKEVDGALLNVEARAIVLHVERLAAALAPVPVLPARTAPAREVEQDATCGLFGVADGPHARVDGPYEAMDDQAAHDGTVDGEQERHEEDGAEGGERLANIPQLECLNQGEEIEADEDEHRCGREEGNRFKDGGEWYCNDETETHDDRCKPRSASHEDTREGLAEDNDGGTTHEGGGDAADPA